MCVGCEVEGWGEGSWDKKTPQSLVSLQNNPQHSVEYANPKASEAAIRITLLALTTFVNGKLRLSEMTYRVVKLKDHKEQEVLVLILHSTRNENDYAVCTLVLHPAMAVCNSWLLQAFILACVPL